jgi:2'-5' RNA ligase
VSAPLVLTLALAGEDAERFDRERRAHFPPERNHLRAHVTLFHALPGELEREVLAAVAQEARRPAFEVAVTSVRLLGRGVAYALESADLAAVHRDLLARFSGLLGEALTAQDRQPLSPHVTVANKLLPDRARELHDQLVDTFAPWAVRATGLSLWRYLGGPWEPVETVPFADREPWPEPRRRP